MHGSNARCRYDLSRATALMALLDPASKGEGREEAVDAFLRAGGPSILRYRLDSMDGSGACGVLHVVHRIARTQTLAMAPDVHAPQSCALATVFFLATVQAVVRPRKLAVV